MLPVCSTPAFTAGFTGHVRRRSGFGYKSGQPSVENPLDRNPRSRDRVQCVSRRGRLLIDLGGSHRRGIEIFGHTLMILQLGHDRPSPHPLFDGGEHPGRRLQGNPTPERRFRILGLKWPDRSAGWLTWSVGSGVHCVPGDQAGSTAVGQVGPKPVQHDRRSVAPAREKQNMGEAP